jgi:zinc and cadmium transporter
LRRPQELGDFGVLLYGGFEKKKVLIYNFVSALTAVAGALITYYQAFQIQGATQVLLPFAVGSFVYIAATNLMPELHKRSQGRESLVQLFTILIGIGLMAGLKILLS